MVGCDLETAIENVVSLLRGAISDRGCAIVSFAMLGGCRVYQKFIGGSVKPSRSSRFED